MRKGEGGASLKDTLKTYNRSTSGEQKMKKEKKNTGCEF